jgi:hypothetical protein
MIGKTINNKMFQIGNWLTAVSKIYRYVQGFVVIIGLWILFRIITSLIAAVASSIRPITEIEQRLQIWPPVIPVSDWLERVFISPWFRWDVEWYTRILLNGYKNHDGTANFHPLYTWLGSIFSLFKFNPVLSLLIISSISTLLLLLILKKLYALDLDCDHDHLVLFVILVFPTSFILFAPYPESTFLLFSVICFYSLRTRRWWIAGASSFFAVLTRPQGLFLIFPYIWELWEASGRSLMAARSHWRSWLTLIYIPLAYIFWIGYRFFIIGDLGVKSHNIQEIIYSVFISSTATKVVPNQGFIWPWKSLYLGISNILISPDLDIWINLILAFLFIWALIIGWKNMTASYRVYSLVIFLVSFSYFTGPVHPFMGLPRHLSLAFPIFIGLTPTLAKRNLYMSSYIILSIVFMMILITAYTLTAWVP